MSKYGFLRQSLTFTIQDNEELYNQPVYCSISFFLYFHRLLFPLSSSQSIWIDFSCCKTIYRATQAIQLCHHIVLSELGIMMAAPSLRPQFFCSRPNGAMTPMIAMDELPGHISVRGVPRALSPNDVHGMTSLGTVSPRSQIYVVDGISSAGSGPLSAPARNNSLTAASYQNQLTSHQPPSSAVDSELYTSLMRIFSDDSAPPGQRQTLQAFVQQAQNLFRQNSHHSTAAVGSRLNSSPSARAGNGRQVR